MSFFDTLSIIGTQEITNKNTKRQIILSNQYAFVSSFVVLPYIGLYLYIYPPLAVFYVFQILVTVSVLYFNAQKLHNTARLMIVLVPIVSVYLSSVFVMSQTIGKFPTGLVMLMLSLCLSASLFISLKDVFYWLMIIPIFGFILIFPDFFMFLFNGKNPDLDFMATTTMDTLFKATAVLSACIILYLYLSNNEISVQENEILLASMELKSQEQEQEKQKSIEYIRQIEANQILEKQREWATAGIAKFSQLFRDASQDDIDLYDKIIMNLAHYLNANQAAIFILEEQDNKEILVLKGCYAYNRKKYLNTTIEIGQGLIGQCVLEKQPIFLAQVPQNYMNITSGLGQSLPSSVLIQPLIINEKVYGVVEMASFEVLLPYKISFVAQLAEIIASATLSQQTNEKTKNLLALSLQQREEMRAQEEEMRQQMEELHATQEELERKSFEIEQVRITEKEQLDNQVNSQKKLMEQFMVKSKEKESALAEELKTLKMLLVEKEKNINA